MSDRQPNVPNARTTVVCSACGAAFDSDQADGKSALLDVAKRHDPGHAPQLEVRTVDYTKHPIFVGEFEHADVRARRPPPIFTSEDLRPKVDPAPEVTPNA